MNVDALMTASPMTCRPADSLHDAAQRLWSEDCGSLPVVDGRNRLVGIITDRDIAMAAYLRNRRLAEVRVADSMSRQVTTCGPTDTVDVAMQRMSETRVRRLPVCDEEGMLLGMLSLADLTRGAVSGDDAAMRTSLLETLSTVTTSRDAQHAILTPQAKTAPASEAKAPVEAKPAAAPAKAKAAAPNSKPRKTAAATAKSAKASGGKSSAGKATKKKSTKKRR